MLLYDIVSTVMMLHLSPDVPHSLHTVEAPCAL